MATKPDSSAVRLNERLEALRADAPAPIADPPRPKVVDTGIFKTALPRTRDHLIRWFLERREGLPSLNVASHFQNLAVAKISEQGFPLSPSDNDLLRAPAPVLEAYQCLDASKQLLTRIKPFLSQRVVEAVAEEIAQEYGKVPGLEAMDNDTAADQILKVIAAALEVGILGTRLDVRPHEQAATYGKGHLKKLSKNRGIQTSSALKKAEICWREMKSLKDANPARSWKGIALQLEIELPLNRDFGTLHWTRILAHTRTQRRKYLAPTKKT